MQRNLQIDPISSLTLSTWERPEPNGSPILNFWAAFTNTGLAGLRFNTTSAGLLNQLPARLRSAPTQQAIPSFPVFSQLEEYLTGRRTSFEIPLDLSWMTSFQQRVLQAVSEIPFGQTCTYSQIAGMIGHPAAARAVGAANGRNPVGILIPCHRLVGADGSLRGYGGDGGLQTKAWLLEHEKYFISTQD